MRSRDVKYEVRKVGSPTPIYHEDVFVLRKSDVFGAAALWAYAHLLQTGIELARSKPGLFSEEECRHLKDMAENTAIKAANWQKHGGGRVPD